MAISFVNAQSTFQNSGTTISINKPTGVAAGDLMVAVLYVQGALGVPTITPPSGWVSRGTDTGTNTRAQVFTKIAGPSESTTYDFTSSLTISAGSGAIAAYRGAILIGNDAFSAVFGTGNEVVAPSVVTAGPNAKLVAGFMTIALGTGVAGMTNRVALDNGSRDVAIFDQNIASPGATGTRTYTGSNAGFGYSLAIEDTSAAQNRIRMMI